MSFYSDASLVLIPSGIKTSKVYSQKPTDGTGDFTFTRASTATRTNSAGLIEKVRTNLFLQSEAFNAANWTKTNVTLTSGILSPDGTNDAFRAESTGVASMIQAITMTNGVTYNISLWIKSAGTGKDTLRLLQQTNRLFDVTATSEWVRYNFSFTNTYPTAGQNNGITRDALGNAFDVYIYGFQLQESEAVSDYIPTTTAAVTVGPTNNVPRLDYMTASGTLATCPMLEVEGQRTNLVLRSEEFDNIYWTKTSTSITANNATAPDGTSSADRLVLSGTTSTSRAISRNLAIVTSTTTVTFSAFVKYVDKQYVQLTFSSAFSSNYANFDLINGTVTAGTYVSASIQSFANGWYRISITTTGLNTACLPFIWAIDTATAIRAANSTSTGTNAYLIWGAQIEDGFFLSTYISTAAATVTRLKDDVVLTGVSALIGQTEGTIFLDVDFRSVSTGGIRQFFQLEGSVGSQVSGTGAATSSNGNNISFSGIANYTLSQGRHKIVCVYNQTTNESKLFVDGAQRGTTGTFSGFLATVDRISILARIDTFSSFAVDQQQFGGCNQFAIWKTALTDAQCNQLSTL